MMCLVGKPSPVQVTGKLAEWLPCLFSRDELTKIGQGHTKEQFQFVVDGVIGNKDMGRDGNQYFQFFMRAMFKVACCSGNWQVACEIDELGIIDDHSKVEAFRQCCGSERFDIASNLLPFLVKMNLAKKVDFLKDMSEKYPQVFRDQVA